MLGMLRTLVREEVHKINSSQTLQEMTTFAKNDKGKPEAQNGQHDDMVIAWAINLAIRHQQTTECRPDEYEIDWNKVPKDYLEDYENSPEVIKDIMLKSWRENGLYKLKG